MLKNSVRNRNTALSTKVSFQPKRKPNVMEVKQYKTVRDRVLRGVLRRRTGYGHRAKPSLPRKKPMRQPIKE